MRLYFVHGWAFGPECFDALAALLPDWPQVRADLGFFGPARTPAFLPGDVLVGHSAGFGWGLSRRADWAGVVAINAFARFVHGGDGRGCVRPAELRALQKAFARDPAGCVAAFRARHGGGGGGAPPNVEALAAGLEFLARWDIFRSVESAGPFAPTLVLVSEDDDLVPLDASKNLAQSGGELALSATGGHGLPWTAPEFCAATIGNFLRRHGW